jgi:TonB family protein
MMPAPTLANLALYVLQAALLIGALALTIAALRPAAALRLAACRGLLLLLLLLPLQVWLWTPPPTSMLPGTTAGSQAIAVDAVEGSPGRAVPWSTLMAAAIGAGMVARLLWLTAGLVRLRRLARGLPDADASAADDVAELQRALGTRARVAFVDRVAQPVTFGIAPPVVLLPASLLAAPIERRRAILCHELLHVRRRDWLGVIGEELALSVLWFHPAAWWLVGELQLAREQVVDQLTVAATGARRAYMDALFSAADLPSAPPLLSGFLRRRHLARRLVSLAEEVVMSRARFVVGSASMVVVMVAGAAVGLAAWPLAPMPSTVQQPDRPIQVRPDQKVVRDTIRIERQTDVPFPNQGAEPAFGELVVDVEATVDAAGEVSATKAATVRVEGRGDSAEGVSPATTATIDAAVASAVNAVRDWRFEAPPRTPAAVLVRIRFAAEPRAAAVTSVTPLRGYETPKPPLRVTQGPRKIVNVNPIYPQEAKDAKVTGIVVIEAVIDEAGSVREAWVAKSVPMLDQAALDAVKQWKFEQTLLNGVPVPVTVTFTVNFTLK